MELWGNGVMNSLPQHSNTASSNTSTSHHQQGDSFVLTERYSSILASADQGIYTRDTHCARFVPAATRRGGSELPIVIGERNEGALGFIRPQKA